MGRLLRFMRGSAPGRVAGGDRGDIAHGPFTGSLSVLGLALVHYLVGLPRHAVECGASDC